MANFWHRITRIGGIPAFACAVLVALCAVGALGWQAASWLRTGDWTAPTIADTFALANIRIPRRYDTASVDRPDIHRLDMQRLADWLLDTPVIFPLLIATALILAFYMWLWRIEDGQPVRE